MHENMLTINVNHLNPTPSESVMAIHVAYSSAYAYR